jgi:hypothetical protein
MSDTYPVVKVAAVQAACVFLDREGSTEKACRLIREAGGKGARVIGFPEGFIPAHPLWYHHHPANSQVANELAVALFKNAVEIPGPQIDARGAGDQRLCRDRRLRKAAADHRHHVQHPGLYRARRRADRQAPEARGDAGRATGAHGKASATRSGLSRASSAR